MGATCGVAAHYFALVDPPVKPGDDVPGHLAMKFSYDPRTDTVSIVLLDVPVIDSDEPQPGVIIDYDASGRVVALEILDASSKVSDPTKVEVSLTVDTPQAA